MDRQKFIPLLLLVAGLLVYSNSLHNEFIFDDLPHIVQNPHIRQLWPPGEFLIHASRPVVMLSVALNYALGGRNPWGYHLFNVGIHVLAALALYGVVRLALVSEVVQFKWSGAAPWLAGVIALIWLVHPLQTESVTYTIQRGESLMGLFYLLTLYCVIRSNGSSRSLWWLVGAVVSCALGMASKPVMVTAPLMALLYDRAFLSTSWREVIRRRWTLYAGLAATWLLLPLLLANAPADWKKSAGYGFASISPLSYALTQPGVILHYLRLAFWPHPLCFDYGWGFGWPVAQTVGAALPALIAVGALMAGTVWAWFRRPALGFLGTWFFLILAPTSSVVPLADLVFEHRMYLPLAAVVALVVVGGFVLGNTLLDGRSLTLKVIGGRLSVAVVLLLAILTVQRNRDYASAFAIWQDTVVKSPNNPRAHYGLGNALEQGRKFEEAIGQYEEALRIKPDYADAVVNLGTALFDLGSVKEAIEYDEKALHIDPELAEGHFNLGIALERVGRHQEAVEQYEQTLRLEPDYVEAHVNLGAALLQAGKFQNAIEQYEQALRIEPDYAEAHNNLAIALFRVGKVSEAVEHFKEAVRIKPDFADAQYNLGNALVGAGKPEDAIRCYQDALRFRPDYAEAHYRLGVALEQTGQFQNAVEQYEESLRIKPDFAEAQNRLDRLQGIE